MAAEQIMQHRLEEALAASASQQTLASISSFPGVDSRTMTSQGLARAASSADPLLVAASAQCRADAAMLDLLLAQRQAAVASSNAAALAGSLDPSAFETALLMDLARKSGSLAPFVAQRPPALSFGGGLNVSNSSILGSFSHLGAVTNPLPGHSQIQALLAARGQQPLNQGAHPLSAFSQVKNKPQELLKKQEATGVNKRKTAPSSSTENTTKKIKSAEVKPQVPAFVKSLNDVPLATATAEKPKRKRRQYRHESFVCRLHRIVTQMEAEGRTDIISFNEDGGGFFLHQPDVFEKEIMPNYFRGRKFCTFRRQLTSYGFSRLRTGGAYRNPHFMRGFPELCDEIVRDKRYDEQD